MSIPALADTTYVPTVTIRGTPIDQRADYNIFHGPVGDTDNLVGGRLQRDVTLPLALTTSEGAVFRAYSTPTATNPLDGVSATGEGSNLTLLFNTPPTEETTLYLTVQNLNEQESGRVPVTISLAPNIPMTDDTAIAPLYLLAAAALLCLLLIASKRKAK